MVQEVANSLVRYGVKRILEQHQWKKVFETSRNNVLAILDNAQDDKSDSIRKAFGDSNLTEIINSLDRNCGYGFIKVIKEKLGEKCVQLEVDKGEAEHYIRAFIKDIQANLRLQFSDFYRDIVLEKSIAELYAGVESICAAIRELADDEANIYSIWQYDAFLRRCNNYKIDLDFFDYDEEEIDKNIIEKISDERILYIKAPCREEGLYYILRLLKSRADLSDDVFVVKDLKSWNKLEGKLSGKILIADFYAEEIVSISKNTIVYIIDKSICPRNKEIIEIPNRTKTNLTKVLLEYINDSNEVNRRLTANISIFPILKRELFDGEMSKPSWTSADLKIFVPALLLSSWSDRIGDKEIVELISGKPFDEYITELQSFTNTVDPFIIRFQGNSYNEFHVADLYQAWYYVANFILENNLKDFEDILKEVVFEQTRIIQNGILNVDVGKYSETLKQGLVKTLIFLNLYNCSNPLLRNSSEKFVNLILKDADWNNIAELLPDLMEAAPREFISAVEIAINNKEASFFDLFKPQGKVPFEYNNYTQLLFALEKGLFIDDIRIRCIRILEKLCKIDVKSNLTNKPARTLSNLFSAFYDETDLSNEIKVELLRDFAKKDSDNAWIVLDNVLPKNLQGYYDYLSKPVYLTYKKKNTTQSTKEIIALYKEYYQIAFTCAGKDLSKWCDLYSDCIFIDYGFKNEAFTCVKPLIKDIVEISDDIKYEFANTVRRFIYECRYFKRRYIKESDINDLEENIYNEITYANANYKFLYAFESEYKPLHPDVYIEKNYARDWDERQKLREREQVTIFKTLHNKSLEEFLSFFKLLKDDYLIGRSLAISLDYEIDTDVCLALYKDDKNSVLLRYFSEIFYNSGIDFAFQQLNSTFAKFKIEFKYILLKSLKVNNEFTASLEKQSKEEQRYYWEHIRPWIKEDDYAFNKYCFDKLLLYGNVNAAWNLTRYNNYGLEDYLQLLHSIIVFMSKGSKFEGSEYDIVSIFEKIYKFSIGDTEKKNLLVRYEMIFSKAFRYDSRGIKPKFIYNQLATDPSVSAELIKLSYKQDNGKEQDLSEEEARIAENAWLVLFYISFCPCVDNQGTYYSDKMTSWLESFLEITKNNHQSKIGMRILGKFLAHFPKGLCNTWLSDEICQFIEKYYIYNGKKNTDLEDGFCIECYNSVGTQWMNNGKENIPFVVEYASYANAAKTNYPFTAEMFRKIAKGFEQEMQNRRERAVHEY